MSDVMIRVENLGKPYVIGHQSEGRGQGLWWVGLRGVLGRGSKLRRHFGR